MVGIPLARTLPMNWVTVRQAVEPCASELIRLLLLLLSLLTPSFVTRWLLSLVISLCTALATPRTLLTKLWVSSLNSSCQLLCNRMTRSLASIAHRTRQTYSDILRHVDARVTSSATQLAQSAIRQGSSSETWLANPFRVTRKSCVSIRALC